MASITGTPTLSIQVNQSTQIATVVVVAQVAFAANEVPLNFRLNCRVFGDDPIADEFLFAFNTHFFTDQASAQTVRFERNDITRRQLNEDIIGADEMVGEVSLDTSGAPPIRKRTNVFQIV